MNGQSDISESFAQDLLAALYRLDAHIGRLDNVCSTCSTDASRSECVDALGALMQGILFELMDPIYQRHPKLGSPSEPGSWLEQERL